MSQSPPPKGRLAKLADLGLDFRPVLRRLRNRLLIPVTETLNAEREARVAEKAQIDSEIALLRSTLSSAQSAISSVRSDISLIQVEIASFRQEVTTALTTERTDRERSYLRLEEIERESRTLFDRLVTVAMEPSLPKVSGGFALSNSFATPRISVVMPVRNRAESISVALTSLRNQTFEAWEAVVVSDGSDDGTDEIVEALAAIDTRIRLFRSPLRGVSAARNFGLQQTRSEIIAYLDSDNRAYPNYLAELVEAFDSDDAIQCAYAVLIGDASYPPTSGSRILWQSWDRDLLLAANFIDMNVFSHRRAVYERLGGFDENLKRLVDWDLILRYTETDAPRRLAIGAVNYNTKGAGRISSSASFGQAHFRIKQKWLSRPTNAAKILIVIPQYHFVDWSIIAAEIRVLQQGAIVGVWSSGDTDSKYLSHAIAQEGPLDEVVKTFGPNAIHLLDLDTLSALEGRLNPSVPITIRTAINSLSLVQLSGIKADKRIVHAEVHSVHFAEVGLPPHIRAWQPVFDTRRFAPPDDMVLEKDASLLLHISSVLDEEVLNSFFDIARRLPGYRIVLVATNFEVQSVQIASLNKKFAESNLRVELLSKRSEAEIATLMKAACFYLDVHPSIVTPPSNLSSASYIVAAMASGTIPIISTHPLLDNLAGQEIQYFDNESLARQILASQAWTKAEWSTRRLTLIDTAYVRYADAAVLSQLFDAWHRVQGVGAATL